MSSQPAAIRAYGDGGNAHRPRHWACRSGNRRVSSVPHSFFMRNSVSPRRWAAQGRVYASSVPAVEIRLSSPCVCNAGMNSGSDDQRGYSLMRVPRGMHDSGRFHRGGLIQSTNTSCSGLLFDFSLFDIDQTTRVAKDCQLIER